MFVYSYLGVSNVLFEKNLLVIKDTDTPGCVF